MPRTAARFTLLAPLLLLTALPALAHNGAVAIAVPIKGITADGDLSDWPDGLTRYPLSLSASSVQPESSVDLSAWFMVGHADTLLHVGVRVRDDSTTAGDDCTVHVGHPHAGDPTAYSLNAGRPTAHGVSVAAGSDEYTYEFQIRLPRDGPGTIGFDVSVGDEDDGSAWHGLEWGPGLKHSLPSYGLRGELGDLILASRNPLGVAHGRLTWKSGAAAARVRVTARSTVDSSLWVRTATDRDGRFVLPLPDGDYAVMAASARDTISVPLGGSSDLQLQGTPPGESMAAIPAPSAPTGRGRRQGSWQTYGAGDRFPAHTVSAVAQDSEGSLWLGTGSYLKGDGVYRYDGSRLWHHTRATGLAHDNVVAIAADDRGTVWVGTRGGLSVLRGATWTSYTVGDGLADNRVQDLALPEDGTVWIATCGGVSHFNGASFVNYTAADGLTQSEVYAVATGAGQQVWAVSHGMPVRLQGDAWYPVADAPAPLEWNRSIAWGGSDRPWIGGGGIARCDAGRCTTLVEGRVSVTKLLVAADGDLWATTWGEGVLRHSAGKVTQYLPADGLANTQMFGAGEDADGDLWFGGMGGSVSRYSDGIVNFTTADGLLHDLVFCVLEDRDGRIWAGTRGGVGRLESRDAHTWHKVGLDRGESVPDPKAFDLYQAADGTVWVGTAAGAARLVSDAWEVFTSEDGLPYDMLGGIAEDDEGGLWFGRFFGRRHAVNRWDGATWQQVGTAHDVRDIKRARDGSLWFGGSGVSRLANGEWSSPGQLGDLPAPISSLSIDADGSVAGATFGAGLCQYDGSTWTWTTTADGLPHDHVAHTMVDSRGVRWIGTFGAGVALHDGEVYQQLQRGDGLGSDLVQDIIEGHNGDMWIATEGGVTRYRRSHTPPRARIVNAISDQSHGPVGALELTERNDHLRIEYEGARVALSLCGAGAGMLYGVSRRREQRRAETALMHAMEEELNDARRLQMSLMPSGAPDVTGVSVGGRCVSANHVGGDFYQYFGGGNRWTAVLADVTGHSMEAAIPAVMFDGILHTHMETPRPMQELFGSLNRSLCRSLQKHTFVCLSMVDLETQTRAIRLANCGCPYPLHYRAETADIVEAEVDAYPLGVREDTEYRTIEMRLEKGDYLVLHSDGFSEATNADGQLFGFDRAMEVIRQGCCEGLSPEDLIERLICEVKAFTGDEPQADDMTCVALRVEA